MSENCLALYYSLQDSEALKHPSCASSAWLENPMISKPRLRTGYLDVNTQFCVDEDMEPGLMTFPATLNLKGRHSHIALGLSEQLEDHELVRQSNILILFFLFIFKS